MDNEIRLIDANRLIRTLRELEWINDNPCDGDNVLEDIINNAPTEERPQGEWISSNNGYYCDKCYGKQWYRSDYCPQCGSVMRGKNELNNELNEL